jgi:iron complex outermembrane receptor protein
LPASRVASRISPITAATRHVFLIAALTLSTHAFAQSTTGDTPAASPGTADTALPAVKVNAAAEALPGDFAPTYSGGQVARGSQVGIFGNKEMIDIPFAMSSYTAKLIEDQQARNIADVLDNDPAVRSGFGFGNFAQVFVIRGFTLTGDDISLNGLYGLTPRQLVATEALERVDVFKGANAFLNGASPTGSAIGGGVNLELKRADDKPLTRVSVDASGSGELGTHVDVGRRFGSEGQFGIRVNSAIRDGETSIDDEHRRSTMTSVALDYRGDKLRLYGDFLYQRQVIDEGRSVVYVSGNQIPTVPSATHNYAQSWTNSVLEDTVGIARAEYDFLPAWTAYVSAGVHHSNERGDYSSPNYNAETGTTAYRLGVPRKSDSQAGEAGVRGQFATGPVTHQVNAGVAITHIEDRAPYEFSGTYVTDLYDTVQVPRPAATIIGGDEANPPVTGITLMKSIAVSDTLGFLNDRVLFTIGARRQQIHENGYAAATGIQNAAYNDGITTPLFGLVVKPWQNVSIYANRTEALAKGDTAPVGSTNFGQLLAPYRSKQYEVGVKYDAKGYGASLAAYQIEKPTAYTDSTGFYGTNGTERHRGLEASVYGEPVKGVRLIAGASYINATLEDTAGGLTDGQKPVGVPSVLFNLGAEYDIPMLTGLTLTARWIHTGSQYLNVPNTLSIPAWDRFDIGARYAVNIYNHPTTFRASVLNVANKGYWASTTGGYLTQGAPRTFLLSLTTDF